MPLLFGEKRRYVILVICIVEMVFMSGIQYGWNSLVPVWKKYDVYGYLCPERNGSTYALSNRSVLSLNESGGEVQLNIKKSEAESSSASMCSKQDDMFSNAFIVSSSFQFIVSFPGGIFFDRFGLRISKLTNGVIFFLSCLLMGLISASRSFLLFPGSCLLSLGATLILLTNFQIGSLFPAWQYLIVSMYSGGFDSSSIVFLLISFGENGGIPMLTSFLILGITGIIVMFFIGFFLFPRRSITENDAPAKSEANVAEEVESLKADGVEGKEEENMKLEVSDEAPKAEEGPAELSLSRCICSATFLSQCVWFSCILFRFNFFLAAYQQHLNFRFGAKSDAAVRNRLNTSLGFFLFTGLAVAPLAGFITDFFKKRFAHGGEITQKVVLRALSLAQALCSLFAVLLCVVIFVPGEAMFYVAFLLEVFTRAFLFSLNGAYFLTAFPPQFFGSTYGLCFVIGGVFTQLQYALLQLNFLWSNGVLLILTLISFIHPLRLSGVFKRCCS